MTIGTHPDFVNRNNVLLTEYCERLHGMDQQATRQDVREQCRELIVRYLRACAADVDAQFIAPIYHAFYAMMNNAPRWRELSSFLERMEEDGIVECAYAKNGYVRTVKLVGK